MKRSMKQDFFTFLPSEIITQILLLVPAHDILSCNRVCKSWRDLVSTHEFVKLHLSKSVPGLALVVHPDSMGEIIEHTNDLHIGITITKLNLINDTRIEGSADGLLLLCIHKHIIRPGLYLCNNLHKHIIRPGLYLCNPITREFINLLHSHSQPFNTENLRSIVFGFGVSKIIGQYKAVGIYDHNLRSSLEVDACKVYTIGTGSWRSVALPTSLNYDTSYTGVFVNGCLHWMATNLNHTRCISCFDLETELFSTVPLPPPLQNETKLMPVDLSTLEGNLYLCHYTFDKDMMDIWSMKEYGVEKIWTKEFVIENIPNLIPPIKISKDVVLLMPYNTYKSGFLVYYTKNKTTQRICDSDDGCVNVSFHSYTPSFLSLKCFGMENSVSF